MKDFSVRPIKKAECKPWLLEKHYSKRMASIVYSFGLYKHNKLIGICTYGMSPNMHLNKIGRFDMLELNRLIVNDNNKKNLTSYFISKTIKKLPNPLALVSYADTAMGHIGIIYQATNWIYTGISKGQSLVRLKNNKILHRRAFDQQINKFLTTNDIDGYIPPSEKHRYFYFIGCKKEKLEMLSNLPFEILPYPKGETKRYDASAEIATQRLLF